MEFNNHQEREAFEREAMRLRFQIQERFRKCSAPEMCQPCMNEIRELIVHLESLSRRNPEE
jgi:hypothetical protein